MTSTEELKTLPKRETIIISRSLERHLIIIGGGPAGLSAGIYAMRMGISTLLIERAASGGLAAVADRIENYPGFPKGIKGMDLTKNFEDQAKEYGLETDWDSVVSVQTSGKTKKIVCEEKTFDAKAVIIASGTELKKLGVPGEDEFLGRGVSYCATCDGPFYKNKKVLVVGGGNSALEEAVFLTNFASMVTVVHRRDKLRADKILELRARGNPKIYFVLDSEVERIDGTDKVESATLINKKTGKKNKVAADGVFVFIGYTPNTSFLNGQLKVDDKGFIITDPEMKTSLPGIFAAGDVRSKELRQVVTAASDGATAAASTYKYLEGSKT